MKGLAAAAALAVAAVAVEILLPGRPIYHSGWYNVALGALVVGLAVAGRRRLKQRRGWRARAAVLALVLGASVAGIAGVANGLFAPDDREVIGAPGERVPVEALGTLVFPLAGTKASAPATVTLERPLHAPAAIGDRPRNAGSFILRATPRNVVFVEARDLRGNRLTITQPQGTVFLSPVLLMQHRQTIAGMDVPFDSFNVPAARRIVKAVLFSPAQAAMLGRADIVPGQGAVLFAVDDENDRPLPNGIAMSAGGAAAAAGGLRLRAEIASYPQVLVVSAPSAAAVAIAALLAIGGLVLATTLPARDDGANVAKNDASLR